MKTFSIAIGLISGLLFGIATPVSKTILSNLNSFQLAGLLYIGSALAFLPHIIKNRKNEINTLLKTGKTRYLIGIITFGGLLGPLFLMLGLKNSNSMSVSIWLNMELVATAIFGTIFFKDTLNKQSLIGIVLTLAAGIIITSQEKASGIISGLLVLLACICWGIDNQLTSLVDGITPQATTFIKGLCGGTVNLIIGFVLSKENVSFKYVTIALLVGIVSYGISIFLYITSAQNLGATRSQILFSTAPFWGILGAYLVLGEKVSLIVLIAAVILVIGIIFSTISVHKHKHIHHAITHVHMHSHNDGHHIHTHKESVDLNVKHSHEHTHEYLEHIHEHYPDIHHRHEH